MTDSSNTNSLSGSSSKIDRGLFRHEGGAKCRDPTDAGDDAVGSATPEKRIDQTDERDGIRKGISLQSRLQERRGSTADLYAGRLQHAGLF